MQGLLEANFTRQMSKTKKKELFHYDWFKKEITPEKGQLTPCEIDPLEHLHKTL